MSLVEYAVCNNSQNTLKLLLEKKASVDQITLRGKKKKKSLSGLILAAQSGSLECLKMLIQEGADINYCFKRRSEEMTPLIAAARSGKSECIEALLNKKASYQT